MSTDAVGVTRALIMSHELQRLLEELCLLPEHGPESCVGDALERMDDVIGMLEPVEPTQDDGIPSRRLRLVT